MKGDPGNRLERKENRIRGKAKTRVQFFSVFILKIKNAFFWRYNPYNIKFLHLKCIISKKKKEMYNFIVFVSKLLFCRKFSLSSQVQRIC